MKAKRPDSVQQRKGREMSEEAFADLKEALEGALAFEFGERRDLLVTRTLAVRPPKKQLPLKDSARVGR